MTEDEFTGLKEEALKQFRNAVGRGFKNPTGLAVLTRGGEIFGDNNGFIRNGNQVMVESCLRPLSSSLEAGTTEDTIPREFEIAAICISQPFIVSHDVGNQVSTVTKNTLAKYPGVASAQTVHVIHPVSKAIAEFKL